MDKLLGRIHSSFSYLYYKPLFLFHYFRLGNGYSYRTSFARNSNTESGGLLCVEDCSERDTLLGYEEPSTVYTGATFVNGGDIKLNGYLDGTHRSGGLVTSDDDSDEEVAFDLSEVKKNQVNVDMKLS